MAFVPSVCKFALLALCAVSLVLARFPPPVRDVKVIRSELVQGVKISYREPKICETTPGVRSYSGYITVPPNTYADQNYPVNTFFWFFESRNDSANAPLSMWLNGGPGSSSLIGLMQENGPCNVNPDSKTTRLNPYSWNNNVNMLYIDQPNQVGYSYDVPTNGTLDNNRAATTPMDFSQEEIPPNNFTFFVGTFPSMKPANSVNSTQNSAVAMWHFLQTWFTEFPEYKPNNNKISLWTESYGGRYGPAFFAYFERQNKAISDGRLRTAHAKILHLDTLGLINACVDLLIQEPSYPRMAWNNTYGIKAIDDVSHQSALRSWSGPGGCKERIVVCRSLAAQKDPHDTGANPEVNQACRIADNVCNGVEGLYQSSGNRGYYDIAHGKQDPFPPDYYLGYLNTAEVQAALGVPVNYTQSSNAVGYGFSSTGDYPRGGYVQDMGYLLDRGVKIALAYGDRDYACNWYGGEEISLNVPFRGLANFRAAGYTPFNIRGETKAYTRQFGNFSFTRVLQAGHEIPAYQPELSLEMFQRAIFNRDIATGTVDTTKNVVVSRGSRDTLHVRQKAPPIPKGVCYILDQQSCTESEWIRVVEGTAIVRNNIVVG